MVNVEQMVVDRLLDVGCGDFVVCGGARNAGFVALLEALKVCRCGGTLKKEVRPFLHWGVPRIPGNLVQW